MTTKTAIVVLADPSNGEEAAGRLFNALAAAYDFDQAGVDVQVVFQGAGTRWPALLVDPAHPLHDVYELASHTIAGASRACAVVFGATAGVEAAGLPQLDGNAVPGTTGLTSLRALAAGGYRIITF